MRYVWVGSRARHDVAHVHCFVPETDKQRRSRARHTGVNQEADKRSLGQRIILLLLDQFSRELQRGANVLQT